MGRPNLRVQLSSAKYVASYRDNCSELDRAQLDMCIMGQISAHRKVPDLREACNELRPMVSKKKKLEGDDYLKFKST